MYLTEANSILVSLPASKVDVELTHLTGVQEKQMLKTTKGSRNADTLTITKQLKTMITSVNGDSSRTSISRFVDTMPAKDSRYLRKVYKKASPNIDLTQDFECSECGHEQPLEVPFTADFFWPDR